MKAFAFVLLVIGVVGSLSAVAREADETGTQSVLVDQGSFGLDRADVERSKQFEQAIATNDFDRALEFASPDDLERVFGAPVDGTAKQIPDGADTSQFTVRIDIDITSYKDGNSKQNLTITYPNQEASLDGNNNGFKTKTVLVSGGIEGRSNMLVGHCYTVHGSATKAVSAKYGSTMTSPIFFRDRKPYGNGQVFAIHGLLGDGYLSKLGGPASHGCIRVSRENATAIRKIVMSNGMANTIVCVR